MSDAMMLKAGTLGLSLGSTGLHVDFVVSRSCNSTVYGTPLVKPSQEEAVQLRAHCPYVQRFERFSWQQEMGEVLRLVSRTRR
jgi:hypothetical protein